jgi:predicted TIM-barrel fold metal-dependent hydrolase
MQIIDFHTHVFPDHIAAKALASLKDNAPGVTAHTDGTLAGLRASMRANGISRSVLQPIATKPEQVASINRGCAKLMADDVIPFGTLFPGMPDFESHISQLKSQKVKGLKFHPEYQDFYIDDRRYFPMYEAIQAAGFVVLFHAGKDPGPFTCDHALPPAFQNIIRNFPRLTVVAAHLGGWKVWDAVEEFLVGRPIHFDTAAIKDFLPRPEILRIIRKHGIERILFGSDSPWYHQGEDVAWIESLELTAAEKERILGLNAAELLGG